MASSLKRTRPGSSAEEAPPASRRRTAQTTDGAVEAEISTTTLCHSDPTEEEHSSDSSTGEEILTGNDWELETTTTTCHTYFREDEFVIMSACVKMMDLIVDHEGPYQDKLFELAGESVQKFNRYRREDDRSPTQLSPAELVDKAWKSVEFMWAPQSHRNIKDGATAFTAMGNAGATFFPVIAFSDSFRENDYPSGESNLDHDAILGTTMGKKTKLLLFKKMKHEFLHVIQRYLDILYNHRFSEDGTPKKYTPWNQADTANPVPELGDHDEEEDAGGLLLPRFNNQKLSETNPLCLQYNGYFLELNDTHVDGLLNMDVYFTLVKACRHDNNIWWCAANSRAVQKGILRPEFYLGSTSNSRARRSAETGTASRTSSPAAPRTPNHGRRGTAAGWRLRGNIPIAFPENYFSRTVSRSSSPTEELRDS